MTARFLRERPWDISALHQSREITVEADGVNVGGQVSQRAGSVQTLVNLPSVSMVCSRSTSNAQLLGAPVASP